MIIPSDFHIKGINHQVQTSAQELLAPGSAPEGSSCQMPEKVEQSDLAEL